MCQFILFVAVLIFVVAAGAKPWHPVHSVVILVLAHCNFVLFYNMLDFVLLCFSLGAQYFEHVNHVALQTLIGSDGSQQLLCDQLVISFALWHDCCSNLFNIAGPDSACRRTSQAHVVRLGSRQHPPLSFSCSDIFVNILRDAQFCFAVFLEQMLPQDASAHFADIFVFLGEDCSAFVFHHAVMSRCRCWER